MFSPIHGGEIVVEPCDAHLIPEALGVSNTTVVSEKDFDNTFGSRNDSVLVRHVENAIGELKDVEVAFYDENMEVMTHQTTVRAKTTLRYDPECGRRGEI